MIGFKVEISGKQPVTASLQDRGVLTAILTWVDAQERPDTELTFDLAGLASTENVRLKWLGTSLQVGDSVTITVVDTEEVDEPIVREPEDPDFVERERRRYYERLKRLYGDD